MNNQILKKLKNTVFLLILSLSFPSIINAESIFSNFDSKLELSKCAKNNTLTMCAIVYMADTQKSNSIEINTAIQGNSPNYYFVTESTGWKKVVAPVKWKSDLVLINENLNAMINVKWHESRNINFEKLASQSIKTVLGKVRIEPTKIPVPFYPFEKNGVIYRVCYGTKHDTKQCTIAAAANLASGTVEIEATTAMNVDLRNQVIQIIVSLDEMKAAG